MTQLGRIVAIALGVWSLMAGAAQAQPPSMSAPVVSGANVTFNWTPTAGASSYNIQAGLASGVYVLNANVGNVTTFQAVAPAIGAYYVRVQALPGGEFSNEVVAVVSSLVTPPATPTNFQAYRNGPGNVVIAWAPGAGGGPVSGYQLRVGTAPGGADLGIIPLGAPGLAAGGIPSATYYLGVRAVNAGGPSPEAPEVALVMNGACDAPPAPTLTTSAWGNFLTAVWSAVPGAASYNFAAAGPGLPAPVTIPFGGNTTQFLYPGLPTGTWNFGVQAVFSCGQPGAFGGSTLVVDDSSLRMQPRAPDPADFADVSYAAGIIRDIANRFGGDLRNSCKEHGGNNRWLFRVVQALRERDKRWGLNWKRANVGDMSQDVITFNWGPDPDEGTFKLRAWDVIGGHCGNNPGWQFSEITNPMPPNYSFGARWTLLPYIQAGFIP
jgi:hypothetical protein